MGVAIVVLMAPGLLIPGAAPAARAAGPDVTLVTTTTYNVLPAEHRVAVSVQVTASNKLYDTVTRLYYVEGAYLAVLPGTSNFHLSGGAGVPKVSVNSRKGGATTLLLAFGSKLAAGTSTSLTLTFDIVDPGGAPDRVLRISPSLVSFQAWAFGTPGIAGSTVRVRFPAGYGVVIGRGPLAGPTAEADGTIVYASDPIAAPEAFIADLIADRPNTLVDGRRSTTVANRTVVLLVRSWPDDPAWRIRVTDLLARGLPELAAGIGIPSPLGDLLTVRETLSRASLGGSGPDAGGGGFDPATGVLDVPYIADPTAILHGAAHAWFNGRLVADRWIAEGFASLYAEQVGVAIGTPVPPPMLAAASVDHQVPLNAWAPGGPNDGFGYGAAYATATAIADRAGADALRDVWAAAASGAGAYQPAGAPTELGSAPPDWRSLLDLLEERTGKSFDGLWRAWVARPTDAPLLDLRTATRARYSATVAAAGSWSLPRSIRDAMRAWRFDDAARLLTAADNVIAQREVVARRAAQNGMTPPAALRVAFEGDPGLAAAAAEATTELAVITDLEAVVALAPSKPDVFTSIGLLGEDPAGELAAARAAFAVGDLSSTLRHSESGRAVWLGAPELGRRRLISAALIALTVLLVGWLVLGRRWRRTRRGWTGGRGG